MHLLRRIKGNFTAFAHDRRASIAPIFGILLLPMLGLMGFAIDVSTMLAERTRAQNMADAGALDAMRIAQSYMNTNGNTTAVFNQIQTTAQSNAVAFMQGLATQDANMLSPSSGVTLTYSNNTLTAASTINYNYQTAFMGLFGFSQMPMESQSGASSYLAKFIQVIFVVDVSESMGVGATDADVNALQTSAAVTAAAGGSCAFACHTNSSIDAGFGDARAVAKSQNITLKIDSVRSAIQDFVTQLSSANQTAPNHYNVGIYTFSNTLHTVLSPTNDFSAINSAIDPNTGQVDLDLGSGQTSPGCWNNCQGWTYLSDSLGSVPGKLSNIGDGSSPTSMLTYVVVLTDGVEDYWATYATDNHQTDADWSSKCSSIRATGATLATVQAIYLPVTTNSAYQTLVAPITTQISNAFGSCASSSDLALTATDGPGVQTAVKTLFAKFNLSSPRLTN